MASGDIRAGRCRGKNGEGLPTGTTITEGGAAIRGGDPGRRKETQENIGRGKEKRREWIRTRKSKRKKKRRCVKVENADGRGRRGEGRGEGRRGEELLYRHVKERNVRENYPVILSSEGACVEW
ncbi:hypothetical protein E2C01_101701 [Portunus trituberculatus]|uniref:Uncharacterized protein n=1 Tax=Portunus trituberculatus TaxID=210409 RepID=A0A5B7KL08_PORTR|nr:hypothetical protein [Portunus trituberculatus]